MEWAKFVNTDVLIDMRDTLREELQVAGEEMVLAENDDIDTQSEEQVAYLQGKMNGVQRAINLLTNALRVADDERWDDSET